MGKCPESQFGKKQWYPDWIRGNKREISSPLIPAHWVRPRNYHSVFSLYLLHLQIYGRSLPPSFHPFLLPLSFPPSHPPSAVEQRTFHPLSYPFGVALTKTVLLMTSRYWARNLWLVQTETCCNCKYTLSFWRLSKISHLLFHIEYMLKRHFRYTGL